MVNDAFSSPLPSLLRPPRFISKVMTLRWRIVKKWCKQILRALDHLHASKPQIVHRNITCSHIYIDGGVGATTIGDLWMAAVLADDPANPIGLSEALTRRLGQYSPASTAPETLDSQPLTTKVPRGCGSLTLFLHAF